MRKPVKVKVLTNQTYIVPQTLATSIALTDCTVGKVYHAVWITKGERSFWGQPALADAVEFIDDVGEHVHAHFDSSRLELVEEGV